MENIHIIAEAGTNHNGNIQQAKELIDIAHYAAADSVKFQIINPWGLYLPGEYTYGTYDIKEVIKIRQSTVFSDEEYEALNQYAKNVGIKFSGSVFDKEGLNLLTKFNPPYIKIASCDLNNLRFLRQVAERGIKMIISTGMSTIEDIEKSIKTVLEVGNKDIVLLHCVSVYPAKLQETNLDFIDQLKRNFGFPVGFSDHTGDSIAACLALTKGATWFEKHFTADKTQKGFDHAYAMEKEGLKQYVTDIRNAQIALMSSKKKITDAERYTRKRARRSIYASRDIKKGEVLTNDDLLIVRPEGILDADMIDLIIGKPVIQDVKQYTALSFDLISK